MVRSCMTDVATMPDLSIRELWLLAPIAAVVLWMGVYPESFMAPMRRDVGLLVERLDRARPVGDAMMARTAMPRVAAGETATHEDKH